MPESYRGFGIASLNSRGQPYYVLPHHKNVFSIGVTETPFKGDAADVCCTDEEVDFLIAETNALLPGRGLNRKDVLSTWAGVRPLTHAGPETTVGRAPRTLHDLGPRGLPGIFALTGGPITTHRSAGRDALDAVSAQLRPSGPAGQIDTTAFTFSSGNNSPPLLPDEPDVRVADIELAVTREHAKTLEDILIRRTGLAWRRRLADAEVQHVANIAAPLLEWSPEAISQHVSTFLAFQDEKFRRPQDT